MKREPKKSGFTLAGILGFFLFIAFIIQCAVLVYDYIIKRTSNAGLIAILMLLVIILLSIITCIIDLIRRKIMVERPVERIVSATEKISSGDFSVRLEIKHSYDKYDEFDVIMENLNMLASELEKSELLKTDFISNVSHEIKTPLFIIQSYATLLQDESLDSEARAKHIKTILSASKRLSSLISNILLLSKLENQALKIVPEQINLTELCASVIVEHEELIESSGIELECELDDLSISSQGGYIEIVISNLLSNAIKFTPEGGKIRVALSKQNEWSVIQISDTGIGISNEVGAKIFEKFYQADTSHSSVGNGLGLALVKRVIDILGGEISLQSELGKGTTFIVKLKDL